ncbi:hypothetical protein NC653_009313 [Populus alba x Populus x berolinensis]|uniref:Uncharacterized protein n=1 Tax=Populus alba x Populus x berolinensis TaxID=444605 RepID=A0AAD6R8L8_9ROSI|nr:hypothetical protein NC653_009313 [Populus alba x Populus x berolinensis]
MIFLSLYLFFTATNLLVSSSTERRWTVQLCLRPRRMLMRLDPLKGLEPPAFSLMGGDQKVKKRKNRECTKCAKKTKTIQHSLRAIGEEIKEIEPENDSMLQMLHKKELGIKQQEADFCDSQNKIITAHENCVGALLQEPLVQNLMTDEV